MSKQPWASGPGEILQHGLSLLHRDNDKNRRLALLSIDNAVELTIKTYLGLPRRVTGINLSRKEFAEISESFPRLLDAIEQHAADKLSGIDLGEIEWFHRLRNQLYHQGNGLTVDRDKVEVYAQLSRLLFRNLFGFDVEVETSEESKDYKILGDFLVTWVRIERSVNTLGEKYRENFSTLKTFRGKILSTTLTLGELSRIGVIRRDIAQEVEQTGLIRNKIVHGAADYTTLLTRQLVERVDRIAQEFEQLAL